MAFKDRLKQLRHERGITQDMLADAIDVPPSTIRRYES
jgi:DNA-binding XRE family transcriptional regulator